MAYFNFTFESYILQNMIRVGYFSSLLYNASIVEQT